MTSTRYIVELVIGALGLQRKAQRLNDAALEMHLLREAEDAAFWTGQDTP